MSHSMRGNGSKGVSNKRDAIREKSSSEQIRCNVRSKNDKDSVGIRTKERTGTSRNRIHMEKDCAPFRDDTFPHWLPWILFPVTLLIRLLYIQQPTNWWILHPDEIFQTVEVAHSDVFGYGFRPYEYLAPPEANSTLLSSALAQKIQYGMYSLRSFILPKILASVLTATYWCGIKTSSFLIVKGFHTIVTSLLPVVIFQFSKTLHHSRDIGCLSAILVSSSLTLNIFGTHTLINSFLAPILFLCLTPLVGSLNSFKDICESNQSEPVVSIETNAKARESSTNNGAGRTYLNSKGYHKNEPQAPAFTCESKQDISSHDENANIILRKDKEINTNTLMFNFFKNKLINFKNTFVASCGFQSKGKRACKENQTTDDILELLIGTGLVLCIYIRFDLILIPVLLLSTFIKRILTNISVSILYFRHHIAGMFIGILIGGYCDYVTYGKWFLAPYQWYQFNVRNNFAGTIFGINSFHFYLLKLYQNEPLIMITFSILFIHILYTVSCLFTMPKNRIDRANNQSIFTFTFLLLAFSLNNHKEFRFLHNAVVCMYISVSVAICSLVKSFSQNQNYRQWFNCGVYLFIALFTSSHWYKFVNMDISDRAKWAYGNITQSHETNMCLNFIRQEKDVNGVFMDRSVYMSGAYSILQHDVPMFAFNIFEFMEFRRKDNNHKGSSSSQRKERFSTFTDISDFISVYNSQYMYKKIRQTPEYNFLILKIDNNFNVEGYAEVFRIGNSKVLKRTLIQIRSNTAKVNDKIFLNATVLEYEGDWLRHYGVYTKAEQRLLMANRLDSSRIGTFRVLLQMYRKLRQADDYRSVLQSCLQVYNKTECLKPYVPVVLHPGYFRS